MKPTIHHFTINVTVKNETEQFLVVTTSAIAAIRDVRAIYADNGIIMPRWFNRLGDKNPAIININLTNLSEN